MFLFGFGLIGYARLRKLKSRSKYSQNNKRIAALDLEKIEGQKMLDFAYNITIILKIIGFCCIER